MQTIFVRTEFDGVHHYADAPSRVHYLRQPHRHTFKVELEIEVMHNDREIEFFIIKDWLNQQLRFMMKDKSCEQMCEHILHKVNEKYGGGRNVRVEVSEEGINGARLYQFSKGDSK